MKHFLLIAGDHYYPSSGTGDWIECFESYKKAEEKVNKIQMHQRFTRGPRKGQIKYTTEKYEINGDDHYTWYDIVDLRDWMK
jgi:hypothetical protein